MLPTAKIDTARTAKARKGPSAPTILYDRLFRDERPIYSVLQPSTEVKTILDYGCGRGADVRWLKERGYQVDGYDPKFAPILPDKTYDAVLLNYVLCVLPEKKTRVQVVKRALQRVKRRRFLCVAVRSAKEIERNARAAGWEKYADGYLTGTGTFQHGFSAGELFDLLMKVAESLKVEYLIDNLQTPWHTTVMLKRF
jgi:DNA phosphorothioation-associated putative methyltransferase